MEGKKQSLHAGHAAQRQADKIVGLVALTAHLRNGTGGFGGGTENAVKDVQRKRGYKPTGEIGENFVKLVMRQQGVLK